MCVFSLTVNTHLPVLFKNVDVYEHTLTTVFIGSNKCTSLIQHLSSVCH
jgi:hypothetical protein